MPDRKLDFFRIIYGENEGFVCLVKRAASTKLFDETFFRYPVELERMVEFCNQFSITHDIYYCPQLLGDRKRDKANIVSAPTLWADLDTCSPDIMLVEPTIQIQSSPGRYQALWVLKELAEPLVAEDICRRIAYYHSDAGADKTGWDLTQLLRVPTTKNHKYSNIGIAGVPQVKILKTGPSNYNLEDFDVYPQVSGFEYTDIPFPETFPDRDETLERFSTSLSPQAYVLLNEVPERDWSRALWQLEMILAEAQMTREEMFAVVESAACNKYKRDGRSNKLLWADVCKAYAKNEVHKVELATGPAEFRFPDLLTDEERGWCEDNDTIIERYVEWAKTLGDAAWQYHQAGAFIVLSSLLSGRVRLPTSYGIVIPNVWFMILADTTLTRKTTAMDIAMDMVIEIDSDAVLATDGSLEGLFTSLSMRPGRPSIFLRDEFSGLLEAMVKKDYYAGMAETFTKLYDGKFQKRVLRKEVLEVRDPCLIIFAGGIKTRILDLLTFEHIASGFLPRFLFISAESDISKLRPLGPPTERTTGAREKLLGEFTKLYHFFNAMQHITLGDKTIESPRTWDAKLTDGAWSRYNQLEGAMLDQGVHSHYQDTLTPTFDRMAKSGLKLAVLLAAARNPAPEIIVETQDIVRAFYYIEQWRPHTMMVIQNIGKSNNERHLDRMLRLIDLSPGIRRSLLMQQMHLTARDADAAFTTLEQRGLITRTRDGKSEKLYTVQGGSKHG